MVVGDGNYNEKKSFLSKMKSQCLGFVCMFNLLACAIP